LSFDLIAARTSWTVKGFDSFYFVVSEMEVFLGRGVLILKYRGELP